MKSHSFYESAEKVRNVSISSRWPGGIYMFVTMGKKFYSSIFVMPKFRSSTEAGLPIIAIILGVKF